MYCYLTKSFILLIIFHLLLLNSCKKNEENNYVFSGLVTDQVTGQAIAGASVSLTTQLFCEENKPYLYFGPVVLSGSVGNFKISIPVETYKFHENDFPCIYVTAYKSGFSGSLKASVVAQNTDSLNIKLIHYGKLSLHVKNDTINNSIDSMEIWISRWSFFNYLPEYCEICRGRKFDEIFLFDSLWSANSYGIQIGSIGRSILDFPPPLLQTSIIINPDVITDYSVTF